MGHDGSSLVLQTPFISSLLLLLALFSLVGEHALHRGHKFVHTHEWLAPVFEGLVEQLMLLGTFSLVVFGLKEAGFFKLVAEPVFKEESEILVELAEYIHILLFIVLVSYLLLVGYLIAGAIRLVAAWAAEQAGGLHQAAETRRDVYRQPLRWYSWPLGVFRRRHALYCFRWHCIREEFLRNNNLPEDYDFAEYLTRCIGGEFRNLVRISPSCWLLLVFLVLVNWARFEIIEAIAKRADTAIHSYMFLIMGALLALLSHLVGVKMRRIFKQLSLQILGDRASIRHVASQHVGSQVWSGVPMPPPTTVTTTEVEESEAHESRPLLDAASVDLALADAATEAGTSFLPHQHLFWFDSPRLITTALQVLQLFTAMFVALLFVIVNMDYVSAHWAPWEKGVVFIAPVITLLVITPSALPVFVVVTSVGELTKVEHMREVRERSDGEHEAAHVVE
jgi:hypothetical protein